MSEQKKKKKSATERPARDLAAEAQQVLDAFGAGVREDRDYPALPHITKKFLRMLLSTFYT